MTLYADIPGVAMQVNRDIVVASIQVDLDFPDCATLHPGYAA